MDFWNINRLLRQEDTLRNHRFYFCAAVGAIKNYLYLYDKPTKAQNEDQNEAFGEEIIYLNFISIPVIVFLVLTSSLVGFIYLGFLAGMDEAERKKAMRKAKKAELKKKEEAESKVSKKG